MTGAVIELEGLALEHGARRVLDGVDLSIAAGEVLGLGGPSGAGKSTLLRAVLGLAVPSAGRIRIDGQLASDGAQILVPPEERGLGVVFQDLALWPHLTVADNVGFALAVRGTAAGEQAQRVTGALRQVGLEQRARSRPGELSGGERQRVAIARALVTRPRAVLLDEPLASVDVLLQRELLSVFRRIFEESGATVLYVTHDGREAFAVADRIALLEDGKIAALAPTDRLMREATSAFARAFVGELAARDVGDG